jgi:hypothetical protein
MKSAQKNPTPPVQSTVVATWRQLLDTLSQCSPIVLDAPALVVLENRFWNPDTKSWQEFQEVFAIRFIDQQSMEESYPRIVFDSRK